MRDPELGPALHKLRSGGKKLFLLTNSLWDYTDAVMRYLLDGVLPEYPSWRNYFDAVVTGAAKPAFFTEQRPLLLLEPGRRAARARRSRWSGAGSTRAATSPIRAAAWASAATACSTSATTSTATSCVQEELALAHLHGGRGAGGASWPGWSATAIRWPSWPGWRGCASSWRTSWRPPRGAQRPRAAAGAEGSGERLADEELEARTPRVKAELETLRRALRDADARIAELERGVEEGLNPHWGLTFKEGNENSRFGEQVEDYACVYTSRVSNFLYYSPMQYFRSPRAVMPHERAAPRSPPGARSTPPRRRRPPVQGGQGRALILPASAMPAIH